MDNAAAMLLLLRGVRMRSKHVSVTVVIVENSAGRDATVGDDEVTPRSRLTTEKSLAAITHLRTRP